MTAQVTGHVRIEDRKGGRVWVAKYVRAEGTPTRKVLGPAWAKESGRRTPRGAPVWRVADGTKPDGYLTPREAQAALEELLGEERRKPAQARPKVAGRTFGDAARMWLTWGELERRWAPSHARRCRGLVDVHLLPEFGEQTPLRRITTPRIDDYRERLLHEGRLSRGTIRHIMVALNGILQRAQRKGWVAHNAATDAEKVTLPRASGDFNVLESVQVEAVARAAEADWQPVVAGARKRTRLSAERADALTVQRRGDAALYATMIRFAAHSGLRLGELRALRWRDVAFGDGVSRVRLNAPVSAPAAAAEKAPKSGRVRSVPLTDPAARTLDQLSRRELFVGTDDRVFPSPTGAIIDGGKVRDAFYRALGAAGLGHLREKDNPVTLHDLRHTFGTLAVRVAPVTDVKEWMGHADLSTTMRYVHHVPRHDAARRLTEAFATETTPAGVEQVPASGGVG